MQYNLDRQKEFFINEYGVYSKYPYNSDLKLPINIHNAVVKLFNTKDKDNIALSIELIKKVYPNTKYSLYLNYTLFKKHYLWINDPSRTLIIKNTIC